MLGYYSTPLAGGTCGGTLGGNGVSSKVILAAPCNSLDCAKLLPVGAVGVMKVDDCVGAGAGCIVTGATGWLNCGCGVGAGAGCAAGVAALSSRLIILAISGCVETG